MEWESAVGATVVGGFGDFVLGKGHNPVRSESGHMLVHLSVEPGDYTYAISFACNGMRLSRAFDNIDEAMAVAELVEAYAADKYPDLLSASAADASDMVRRRPKMKRDITYIMNGVTP